MKSVYRLMLLRPLDAAILPMAGPGDPLSPAALRILMLLLVIITFNIVDLIYTLFAHSIGWLHEMNPLAEIYLSQGLEPSLICYKILMVLGGCTMLWRLHSSRWTAPACWILVAANVGLALLWYLWTREVIGTFELRNAAGW